MAKADAVLTEDLARTTLYELLAAMCNFAIAVPGLSRFRVNVFM